MTQNKLYYKLCLQDTQGGEVLYRSLIVEGKASVTYSFKEFTSAPEWLAKKGFHPLVFDNVEAAKEYGRLITDGNERYSLFAVEVQGVVEKLPNKLYLSDLERGIIRERRKPATFPKGTVMVKKVRLVKRIDL